MRRLILIGGVCVVAGGALGGGAIVRANDPPDPGPPAVVRQATSDACDEANAGVRDDFWAGDIVDGLALSAIIEQCEDPNPQEVAAGLPATAGLHAKTYVYGSCIPPASLPDADSEGGCAPPLEVQLFDACRRNASLYEDAGDQTVLRGVPAARFTNGHRRELYTGRTTIVVWSASDAHADAAVKALRGRGAMADVTPGSSLPAPAAGAREGRLRC